MCSLSKHDTDIAFIKLVGLYLQLITLLRKVRLCSSADIETNTNLLRVVTCYLCTNIGEELDQLFTLYCHIVLNIRPRHQANLLLTPKTNFKNRVHKSLLKLNDEYNSHRHTQHFCFNIILTSRPSLRSYAGETI